MGSKLRVWRAGEVALRCSLAAVCKACNCGTRAQEQEAAHDRAACGPTHAGLRTRGCGGCQLLVELCCDESAAC